MLTTGIRNKWPLTLESGFVLEEGQSTTSKSNLPKEEDTTAFDDEETIEIECMAGLDELASSRMEEDAQFLFRDEMDGATSDNEDFEEYDSSSNSSDN